MWRKHLIMFAERTQVDLPTNLYKWLSDLIVGRDIQVNLDGFS